jgi:hypothetical protein
MKKLINMLDHLLGWNGCRGWSAIEGEWIVVGCECSCGRVYRAYRKHLATGVRVFVG